MTASIISGQGHQRGRSAVLGVAACCLWVVVGKSGADAAAETPAAAAPSTESTAPEYPVTIEHSYGRR